MNAGPYWRLNLRRHDAGVKHSMGRNRYVNFRSTRVLEPYATKWRFTDRYMSHHLEVAATGDVS